MKNITIFMKNVINLTNMKIAKNEFKNVTNIVMKNVINSPNMEIATNDMKNVITFMKNMMNITKLTKIEFCMPVFIKVKWLTCCHSFNM